MSKFEPRHKEIRQAAASIGWAVTWRRQGSKVYATVTSKNLNPFECQHDEVRKWLREWYSDPQLTSGSYKKWNFLVYDLIELLKKKY